MDHRLVCHLLWQRGLHNSLKIWAMTSRATQDRQVIERSSDKTWSAEGGDGKPLHVLAWRTLWTLWKGKTHDTWRWARICEPRTSRCTSWVWKRQRTRDQTANILWTIEKAREFQKNICFCFIDYAKAFDCVDHKNCWTFLKRWEYQPSLPVFWETCMWVKQPQLEPYMEQWTGEKLEKEYEAVYCHPVYLTSMQSISCKMLGWMNHKLESRLPGEISTTSDMQMIPF